VSTKATQNMWKQLTPTIATSPAPLK